MALSCNFPFCRVGWLLLLAPSLPPSLLYWSGTFCSIACFTFGCHYPLFTSLSRGPGLLQDVCFLCYLALLSSLSTDIFFNVLAGKTKEALVSWWGFFTKLVFLHVKILPQYIRDLCNPRHYNQPVT